MVRSGWGGNKTQKLETKEIKFRLNYSKEGKKNNSSVNSSKIDRKGEKKIFFF
jgi:hypothetical protein